MTDSERLTQGACDFNEGRHFEAHEHWEAVWKSSIDPERTRLKALIQACGVFIHLRKGRLDPAGRLALRCLEHLAGATAHEQLHGTEPRIHIEGLEEAILRIAALLRTGILKDSSVWEPLVQSCRAVFREARRE